jgi:hypothetical protein
MTRPYVPSDDEKRVIAWLRKEAANIKPFRGLLPWRWYARKICAAILRVAAKELEKGKHHADH